MAKPRVTITLGSSGKVVKMGNDVMVGHGRLSGSKRFIPDKPWTDGGADNVISSNKRQQGNGAKWRSGGSREQGSRIAGNDLRLRLIRKRRPNNFQSAFEGRRARNSEKLSRDIRPPRYHRKHPPALGTSGIDHLTRITQNGISDALHMYSLQTMDESRGFAEMPKITPSDLARADLVSNNGGFDPSETSLIPITEKTITTRPVTYVSPMSGIKQRRPNAGEELFTVSTLLNSLGLGKYAIHFKAEEVDMTALRQMGDKDLKELGMPMGPRKKLLLALTPPSRCHLSRVRL